ncbi:MAG: DEAD/DEAH box helicase [Gammaproteobacteria bacterium]|nr:DEAD/DEAH box helicase [Gammaproteobacteria bacterium]
MQTIQQSIEQLHRALSDYIEATYHISAESLIRRRKALLGNPGVIHQIPYLESTPRYETGKAFSEMDGLAPAALEVFKSVSQSEDGLPKLVYDPPYMHQSEAVQGILIDRRNLVIMTGTGSGKTESFLLPILGKLAREAAERPDAFANQCAMRALVLYPMNALVNDQLGRLRGLYGDPRLVSLFNSWAGRPPRFGRYTSRTPYAGVRTPQKDSSKYRAFNEFYVDIERLAHEPNADGHTEALRLMRALKERGKWPAKPSLQAWIGEKGSRWRDPKTGAFVRGITLPDDSELLTRHEIQSAPPDLLVTNYSMLEYMMMRPIERRIFDLTRT